MSRSASLAWMAVALAVGACLRAAPMGGDFWLDEIWTYDLARGLDSASAVFTQIHHSNNHHLNTLIFYALGERPEWAVYRVPALVAGVASIALAAGLALRRGRLEGVLAAWLVALCFPLVHFSSEARGYALSLCFALAALWALERDLERPRAATALAFGACVILGFLSQLVFLFFYAGAAVESLVTAAGLARSAHSLRPAVVLLLRLHALPLLALALLTWVDLREFRPAGGSPFEPAWFTARLVGYALGLPVRRELAPLYAVLAAVPWIAGLRLLWRERRDLAVGLAVAGLVAPLLGFAVVRPEVVAVRYFLIGIALTLLIATPVLADALRRGGVARALAAALLLVYAVGNGVHAAGFLEDGRGGYGEALAHMARATPGPRIVVGGRHDWRNQTVLEFYAPRVLRGQTLEYHSKEDWPPGGPAWFIWDRAEAPEEEREELVYPGGVRFRRVATFDHAALSGFTWTLYRNASARRSSTTPKPESRKGRAPTRPTGS